MVDETKKNAAEQVVKAHSYKELGMIVKHKNLRPVIVAERAAVI